MITAKTIKLTKIKEIISIGVFVAMAVYAPMVFHFFGGINAGREFLPMHFFVLVAGLSLGWRAGLITGLASPLISYLLTGMPVIDILPFIIVELAAYGTIAGLLRGKYNLLVSLFGAMVAGRLLVGAAMYFFGDMNAINFMLIALKTGWQGIVLQIIFVPVAVKYLRGHFKES